MGLHRFQVTGLGCLASTTGTGRTALRRGCRLLTMLDRVDPGSSARTSLRDSDKRRAEAAAQRDSRVRPPRIGSTDDEPTIVAIIRGCRDEGAVQTRYGRRGDVVGKLQRVVPRGRIRQRRTDNGDPALACRPDAGCRTCDGVGYGHGPLKTSKSSSALRKTGAAS